MKNQLKNELIKSLAPQKAEFNKLLQKINGQLLGYANCRTLEDFFDKHNETMADTFITTLLDLKNRKEDPEEKEGESNLQKIKKTGKKVGGKIYEYMQNLRENV